MPKLLLTGASGLLGRYLYLGLSREKDFEVFTIGRTRASQKHIFHDFLGTDSLGDNLPDFDILVHAAANVSEGLDRDFSIVENNLKMTHDLAYFSMRKEVKKFVFISSVSVYGNFCAEEKTEDSKLNPDSSYAVSKVLCEHLLEILLRHKCDLSILRPSYILGKPLPKRYFLSKILERLIKKQEIILENPDLTKFNFVFASDVQKAVLQILKNGLRGVYNIVGDESISLREVFNLLEEVSGFQSEDLQEKVDERSILCGKYSNEKVKRDLDIKLSDFRRCFVEVINERH